jgi:hypothetical protein
MFSAMHALVGQMLVKMLENWTMVSILFLEPLDVYLVCFLLFFSCIRNSVFDFCTDMIRRRTLRTRAIKMLVLDEADEMLNKGFKEQIYDVYRYLPPATQVFFLEFNP